MEHFCEMLNFLLDILMRLTTRKLKYACGANEAHCTTKLRAVAGVLGGVTQFLASPRSRKCFNFALSAATVLWYGWLQQSRGHCLLCTVNRALLSLFGPVRNVMTCHKYSSHWVSEAEHNPEGGKCKVGRNVGKPSVLYAVWPR
jgi:hypothetical protein